MVKYSDKKISEFLESLSSRSPVPGGGSAAALVGAVGASLLGMVAHFTLGKKGYEKQTAEMKKMLLTSYRIRDALSRLIDEDVESYLEVSRAQRAAKLLTKEESRARVLAKALRKALASSLTICKLSHHGLLLSKKVIQTGNQNLKSDAKTACRFLFASFQGGCLMSEANVQWLGDGAVSRRVKKILSPLRQEAEKVIKEIQSE